VAAAGVWPAGVAIMARLAVAWLVAVPLLGAVWSPLLGTRRPWPTLPPFPEPLGRLAPDARARFAVLRGVRVAPADLDVLLGAVVALAVSAVLSTGVLAVTAAALAAVLATWARRGRPPADHGPVRGLLEIAVPALVGWAALGGSVPVPAPVAVNSGPLATAARWLVANWLALAVVSAFTVVYHGVAGQHPHSAADRHVRWVASGYVAAVVALALAARPFGASMVAMLLVAQWPLIVAARSTSVSRYGRALQVMAMAAMAVAAASVGWRL
jgi:hypothetical protein